MCAHAQVSKKLKAGRKRCSSVGWTQQAEIDLLCEFWSRLANGNPSYRFPFNGFDAMDSHSMGSHSKGDGWKIRFFVT